MPRDCTCWVALSHATPDNGCLYVIPRGADPAYELGDCSAAAAAAEEGSGGGGSQAFALGEAPRGGGSCYLPGGAAAWQHVRALPCAPGDALCFSHRIVHWGSCGRPVREIRVGSPVHSIHLNIWPPPRARAARCQPALRMPELMV